jgi:L-iditol 2-dehydrogenase
MGYSGSTMLAAVYHGPDDLRVEGRPVPTVGPGEALLRVMGASICGTDLRILHGGHRMYPPGTVRVPGHELTGELVAVGSDVRGLRVGQRVFVAPNIGCGHCRQCLAGRNNLCPNYDAFGITLDGGFAEYMLITAPAILQGNVIPIPDSMDPAVAALIEPFACVLHGQDALNIRPGDVVLVIGAGPIGIMHLLLAKLSGASKLIVSEMMPDRLEQARRFGADRAVNPGEQDLRSVVAEESGGEGADVVIVAAPSHRAQEEAVQLAAIRGRINFFGGLPKDRPAINLDSNVVHYRELIVTGTTACSTADCRRAAEIIASGRIDLSGLVSARFPLAQAREALAAAEDRSSLKIVLQPA